MIQLFSMVALRQAIRRATCLLTAVSFLTFTVRPAWAGCAKDTDCKGDRICDGGRCVSPAAPGPAPAAPAPSAPPAPSVSPPPASGSPSPAAPPAPPLISTPPAGAPSAASPNAVAPVPMAPEAAPVPYGARAPEPPSTSPPQPPPVVEQKPAAESEAVAVSSADGKAYVVSISSGNGEECATPCTLQAPPGSATLRVRGAKTYDQPVFVGHRDMRIKLRAACSGCFVAGSIALGVGVVLDIAAVPYIADMPNCDPYSGTDLAACKNDKDRFTLFAALFGVTGAVLTVVGLVSLLSGARHGRTKAMVDGKSSNVNLLGASFVPLREGGGTGGLKFSF